MDRQRPRATTRLLNDRFRKNRALLLNHLEITDRVAELLKANCGDTSALIDQIAAHDEFDQDSDPYGEGDFGALDFCSHRIVWRILYFAPDMKSGSPNPADSKGTVRVISIMLASEC